MTPSHQTKPVRVKEPREGLNSHCNIYISSPYSLLNNQVSQLFVVTEYSYKALALIPVFIEDSAKRGAAVAVSLSHLIAYTIKTLIKFTLPLLGFISLVPLMYPTNTARFSQKLDEPSVRQLPHSLPYRSVTWLKTCFLA